MKSLQSIAILWRLSIVAALLLWMWGVNLPYVGLYNANNNYLSIASENFLKYGYSTLHFLPTYYIGENLPAPVPYYLHHPTLFFLPAAVPFAVFGYDNWVVHVAPFFFTAGSLVFLYMLIRQVNGRSVAGWSLFFASLFPMVSFFWKYMFFEQASLFFTLICLNFITRYTATKNSRLLWGVFFSSALGMATDWYGGYVAFGLLYLWFRRRDTVSRTCFLVYAGGVVLGLGSYLAALWKSGNLLAFWEGLAARGLTGELTTHAFWPVRLFLVTLLRLGIYFSPFIFFALWGLWRTSMRNRPAVRKDLLVVLFIIGLINLFVLPTASWGHSYFLYYLVPFTAYVLGIWMDRISHRSSGLLVFFVFLQLSWSVAVNGLKISQVAKQSWKYDLGKEVSIVALKYSAVGVLGYPGDVLENYFSIRTISMTVKDIERWAEALERKELSYVVITCEGLCNQQELNMVESLRDHRSVRSYTYGVNRGWIVGGAPSASKPSVGENDQRSVTGQQADRVPFILYWYRAVRDILGSPQI